MRRHVAAGAASLTALLAISAMTLPAQAGSPQGPSYAWEQPDEGGEYVVAFDAANQEQALQAIADAGGVVIDVLAPVGLALVSADAGFATAVEADASVTGAVQNAVDRRHP